jgi:hypothetical protein
VLEIEITNPRNWGKIHEQIAVETEFDDDEIESERGFRSRNCDRIDRIKENDAKQRK